MIHILTHKYLWGVCAFLCACICFWNKDKIFKTSSKAHAIYVRHNKRIFGVCVYIYIIFSINITYFPLFQAELLKKHGQIVEKMGSDLKILALHVMLVLVKNNGNICVQPLNDQKRLLCDSNAL